MNMDLLEKSLGDSFYMKEKTAEWQTTLTCNIKSDKDRVISCHVFANDGDSCFIHIQVRYTKYEDTLINVYALKKGCPTNIDYFTFKVLSIWKDELKLEDTDYLGYYVDEQVKRPELYEFDKEGGELRKIVFVNGELLTDI